MTYHTTATRIGFVIVATQVCYALGMLCFVPLGDLFERRALIVRMYGGVAVALLMVTVAPRLGLLIGASVLVGLFASVTHLAVPIAPDLVK